MRPILTGRGSVDERVEPLRHHRYFRKLGETDRREVARLGAPLTLGPGEILALEGDPCTAVYLVLAGRIQALKVSPEGREQIVDQMLPGQLFYLVPALDGQPLPVTTKAAEASSLLLFPRDAFLELLGRHPSVCLAVLAEFARRLRRMSSLVEDLSLRSVRQRLAALLVDWAQASQRRRMTQREMAMQLGTVREVVARMLAQFELEGMIAMHRGRIQVRDLQALREAAA